MRDEIRLPNGVVARSDGGGDLWEKQHRKNLSRSCLVTDIDSMFAAAPLDVDAPELDVPLKTEKLVRVEYAPDPIENRGNLIREFGIVALFESKASLKAVDYGGATLASQVQMHICKTYSKVQPIAARFFFVIGTVRFAMQEMNVFTGKPVGRAFNLPPDSSWMQTWDELGLLTAHRELRKWLKQKK